MTEEKEQRSIFAVAVVYLQSTTTWLGTNGRPAVLIGFLVATGAFLLLNLSTLGCEYAKMYGLTRNMYELSRGLGDGGPPPEWSEIIYRTYHGFPARVFCTLAIVFVIYQLPVVALMLLSRFRLVQWLVLAGLGLVSFADFWLFSRTFLAPYDSTVCRAEFELLIVPAHLLFGVVTLAFGPIVAAFLFFRSRGHKGGHGKTGDSGVRKEQ